MPLIRSLKDNFNQGELGPFLLGREDNQLYAAGALKVENWMLLPHGGIIRRPGFQNIDDIHPIGNGDDGGGDVGNCEILPNQTIFVRDTFSGSPSDLSTHTGEEGAMWTRVSLTTHLRILDNQCQVDPTTGNLLSESASYTSSGTATGGRYKIVFEVHFPLGAIIGTLDGGVDDGVGVEIVGSGGLTAVMELVTQPGGIELHAGYIFHAQRIEGLLPLDIGQHYTGTIQITDTHACFFLQRSTDGFYLDTGPEITFSSSIPNAFLILDEIANLGSDPVFIRVSASVNSVVNPTPPPSGFSDPLPAKSITNLVAATI